MIGTIEITGLNKTYKVFKSPWDKLKYFLGFSSWSNFENRTTLFDLDLKINSGESVGIVGLNGAGKSTILKLVAGTLLPTSGQIKTNGRLSAILELGIGFHPDFTGRENINLVGNLLGLSQDELRDLFGWITSFSELENEIDQPFRVYSSGMQMRLAFALATAKRPDILIVDEALSVGDAFFQHKCFDRIRHFKRAGTTILMVSHDKNAVLNLCDRAILIHAGHKDLDSKPVEVFDRYNALLAETSEEQISQKLQSDGVLQTISGNGAARVTRINLQNDKGEAVHLVDVGQPLTLCINIKIYEKISNLVFGFVFKDSLGQDIFGTNTAHLDIPISPSSEAEDIDISFSLQANLGVGEYSISTSLSLDAQHINSNIEWKDFAYKFQVVNKSTHHFVGKINLPLRLKSLSID